jgi:GT2 family glycosyltransferase
MHDLAIIITAMNEASWLEQLLPTIPPHSGGISLDVVVADIESSDGTAELVAAAPGVRSVPVINRGFAHANNVALQTVDARYVLFLNADTEFVDGTLASLVEAMDARPDVGMAGVKQLDSAGALYPTMRRFLTARRAFAEAFWSERLRPSAGQRVLDLPLYDHEQSCDWTIGSFMLVRREALMSAGTMDERFFFTGEEQDFCLRVRAAGWDIRHFPILTIVHHVGKRGVSPRFAAQGAYAERQYIEKNFVGLQRHFALLGTACYHVLRAAPLSRRAERPKAARAALRALRKGAPAPFIEPPATAMPAGQSDAARAGKPT